MVSRPLFLVLLLGPLLVVTACFAAHRPCYSPQAAAAHAGNDICIAAHVYHIEQGADGTRYLDVCPPSLAPAGTSDACPLLIISLSVDRKEVGALTQVESQDVQLRGTVHAMHGQAVLLLSNSRQFHDGPEKFRPNPELLAGFSTDRASTAFNDPTLRGKGHKGSSTFNGKLTPIQ
jgi:hypothetical protein